jgi:hypothetical protein
MMNHATERILVGAGAGALATLPMSAVMLVAQRLGLLGKAPPAKITDAALGAVRVIASRRERKALTGLAHLGFGAGVGALFSLVRPAQPTPARAAVEGAAFATAVWGLSYAGWVPALGIMPPPSRDRPGRPATMLVAHWVFGAVLGVAIARWRRATPPDPSASPR